MIRQSVCPAAMSFQFKGFSVVQVKQTFMLHTMVLTLFSVLWVLFVGLSIGILNSGSC